MSYITRSIVSCLALCAALLFFGATAQHALAGDPGGIIYVKNEGAFESEFKLQCMDRGSKATYFKRLSAGQSGWIKVPPNTTNIGLTATGTWVKANIPNTNYIFAQSNPTYGKEYVLKGTAIKAWHEVRNK